MLKSDVIAYFKSQQAVAKALGVTKSAVSLWKQVIPEGRAYQIESLTRRALRVNPEVYAKSSSHPPRGVAAHP